MNQLSPSRPTPHTVKRFLVITVVLRFSNVLVAENPRTLKEPRYEVPANTAAVRLILHVPHEHTFLDQRPEDERAVAEADDDRVQRRRVGDEEGEMGNQVAGVNRMPHERV